MNLRISEAALSVGLLLAGCTQAASSTIPPVNTQLDIAAAFDGGTVVVTGSSNLPDGALIFVYVWHPDESLQLDSENLVPLVGGRYEVAVDVTGWPSGVAHASAAFLLDGYGPQPSHVLVVVGAFGERLAGPHARDGEYGYRLVQSDIVDVPL
jgi:hypothetical protein